MSRCNTQNQKQVLAYPYSSIKTGPRIWLLDQYYSRIVFEEPRPILDLKISKTFLKSGLIEFSWADILHKNSVFFNDVDGNGKI
jgi:hypothetical protein